MIDHRDIHGPGTPRTPRLRSVPRHGALLLLLVAACASPAVQPSSAAPLAITDPARKVAESSMGMVASASTLATEVGARVLAEGGNAVDAAAATSFALAVTEPTMSGLGGRASILIRTPAGEIHGIDGLTQVPRSYRAGAPAGYASAGVPGVPAAVIAMVERYGTWPLHRIMAPAIRLAEDGFPMNALEATRIAEAAATLRTFEGSRRAFLKRDGSAWAAGDRFVQPDLARTLRAIADSGARVFYRGWIADSIHADMARHGGFITREDLAAYEARPAIIVRGSYRGHGIAGNFDPASGHAVIEALHILERFDPGTIQGVEYASVVAQAMQLAIADRYRTFGSRTETARRLTSKEHAAERAQEIGLPGPAARVPPGDPRTGDDADAWRLAARDNTTHFSVVDANRMAVSLTQSLGQVLGSQLATPGLGFIYGDLLGSEPGTRPASTISPTIVTDSAGRLLYVLGGAGGARIIPAIVQTLSHAIDRQLPLDRAMAAPRVAPVGAAALRVEMDSLTGIRWTETQLSRLASLGFALERSASPDYGRIHAVVVDHETGRLIGVAEPRGVGGAAGPASRGGRPAGSLKRSAPAALGSRR